MSSEKITFLIRAIHDALQSSEQLDGVQQTISRLAALDLDGHRCSPLPPQIPLHFESELKAAVAKREQTNPTHWDRSAPIRGID